jgi:proto-oncogene tyrosine-protein kinase ROS
MFQSQFTIFFIQKGVALHIRENLLFVSESLGRVVVVDTRLESSEMERTRVLMSKGHGGISFAPYGLSIDWLNDQLYVLGKLTDGAPRWQIARCSTDGSGLTVAVAGLLSKPLHVEVDPYNGYFQLFLF